MEKTGPGGRAPGAGVMGVPVPVRCCAGEHVDHNLLFAPRRRWIAGDPASPPSSAFRVCCVSEGSAHKHKLSSSLTRWKGESLADWFPSHLLPPPSFTWPVLLLLCAHMWHPVTFSDFLVSTSLPNGCPSGDLNLSPHVSPEPLCCRQGLTT